MVATWFALPQVRLQLQMSELARRPRSGRYLPACSWHTASSLKVSSDGWEVDAPPPTLGGTPDQVRCGRQAYERAENRQWNGK